MTPTRRLSPGVFRTGRGEVLHLFWPGYLPPERTSQVNGYMGMCGATAWFRERKPVAWLDEFPTRPEPPMRWCRICLGHALEHFDLTYLIIDLVHLEFENHPESASQEDQ